MPRASSIFSVHNHNRTVIESVSQFTMNISFIHHDDFSIYHDDFSIYHDDFSIYHDDFFHSLKIILLFIMSNYLFYNAESIFCNVEY